MPMPSGSKWEVRVTSPNGLYIEAYYFTSLKQARVVFEGKRALYGEEMVSLWRIKDTGPWFRVWI
jgi:hypothetical protein